MENEKKRSAKEVVVKIIPSNIANAFVKAHHYSGKVVSNSQLHFGCFLDGMLHGVMSYGCPLDRSKVMHLVKDENGKPALWNEMLELNRMAFDEVLPPNSESRCISISIRLIRKNAPHIRWILSFSDGSHCGDGTIYRASGFILTQISETRMCELPPEWRKYNGGGKYAHIMTLHAKSNIMYKMTQKAFDMKGKYYGIEWYADKFKTRVVSGYQLRYIYIVDKRFHYDGEIIPFSKIDEIGAGMYKG